MTAARTILLCLPALPIGLAIGVVVGTPRPSAKAVADWQEVSSILRTKCAMCHGGVGPAAGLSLETYDRLMKGGASGPPVKPRAPRESLIVKRIEGEVSPQMPLGQTPLSAEQRQAIVDWIAAGANGPSSGVEKPVTAAAAPFPQPGESVTYRHVAAIFGKRCVMCHGAEAKGGPPEGLRLDTYENVLGSSERAVIVPGFPASSRMYRVVQGLDRPRMPYNLLPLSDDEIRVIGEWIRQGARSDDGKAAAMPVGREVRFRSVLTGFWSIKGLRVEASGARIDKRPRVGENVEIRGIVQKDGGIRATRIRSD